MQCYGFIHLLSRDEGKQDEGMGEERLGTLGGDFGRTGSQSHTQAHRVHTCQKVHETATQFSTIRAISQSVQTNSRLYTEYTYYIYAKVYINVILGACYLLLLVEAYWKQFSKVRQSKHQLIAY